MGRKTKDQVMLQQIEKDKIEEKKKAATTELYRKRSTNYIYYG